MIPWKVDARNNNASLLRTLQDHADACDLALVFLTKDFEGHSRSGGGPVVLPSPNCSLELGLFMGALGDTTRCLVISTLPNPFADLRGQILPPLVEPDNYQEWQTGRWHRAVVDAAEEAIRSRIIDGARLAYRVAAISLDELFNKEAQREETPRDSRVLIRAAKPAEQSVKYAKVVLNNFRFAVDYHYVFDSAAVNYSEIGVMLRSLALAGLVCDTAALDNAEDQELHDMMSEHKEEITRILGELERRLYIHFVPHKAFEEFCIHNCLGQRGEPQGYLKWSPRRFVLMPPATIVQRVEYYDSFTHMARQYRETIFAEDQSKRERDALKAAVLKKFPRVLTERVAQACFGNGEDSIPVS